MQWQRQTGIACRGRLLARQEDRYPKRQKELRELNVPDAGTWKDKAAMLRCSADQERNPLERQTLLTLAEDCEAIATDLELAQQPGKPKPPGNPPKPPGREAPQPIREPPRPMPPPPVEPPPPPMTAQKLRGRR
jgi:hypothetical protein